MKQENYFTSNRDLLFTFEHVIPWNQIVPAVEGAFSDSDGPAGISEAVDLYKEALSLIGGYAGNEIASRAREVDRAGSDHYDGPIAISEPLRRNLDGLRDLGVCGLSVPRATAGRAFRSPCLPWPSK